MFSNYNNTVVNTILSYPMLSPPLFFFFFFFFFSQVAAARVRAREVFLNVHFGDSSSKKRQ